MDPITSSGAQNVEQDRDIEEDLVRETSRDQSSIQLPIIISMHVNVEKGQGFELVEVKGKKNAHRKRWIPPCPKLVHFMPSAVVLLFPVTYVAQVKSEIQVISLLPESFLFQEMVPGAVVFKDWKEPYQQYSLLSYDVVFQVTNDGQSSICVSQQYGNRDTHVLVAAGSQFTSQKEHRVTGSSNVYQSRVRKGGKTLSRHEYRLQQGTPYFQLKLSSVGESEMLGGLLVKFWVKVELSKLDMKREIAKIPPVRGEGTYIY